MYERVALLLFMLTGTQVVGAVPVDQILMNAMPKDVMYDTFQMSPDGKVTMTLEMDIKMDIKQYMSIKASTHVTRQKRKALANLVYRWENCYVYYEIREGDFSGKEQKVIEDAMKEWETYTCLRFKPAEDNRDKIVFQIGNGGCYSYLGKIGGAQEIGLGKGCVQKHVVVHEIGHAIGWIHEQSRPDRDEFIRVNFNRIPEPLHPQFEIFPAREINDYGVHYDYRSIMHYSQNAVVERSIETYDPTYQSIIGQAKGLSFRDVQLANLMYNCSAMSCGLVRQPGPCSVHGTDAFLFKLKGRCQCVCPGGDGELLVPCQSSPVTTTTPATTTITTPATTTEDEPMECVDLMPDCAEKAEAGECRLNMERMDIYCKKSCKFCGKHDVCMDMDSSCPLLASAKLCDNPDFEKLMHMLCKKSCHLCTPVDPCTMQRQMGMYVDEDHSSGQTCSTISTAVWAIVFLFWTLY